MTDQPYSDEDVQFVADAVAGHLLARTGLREVPAIKVHALLAEARAALDALHAAGRLLPSLEDRRQEEWEVCWRTRGGGHAMSERHLSSRGEAERLGPSRIGQYNITGYTLSRRELRAFADGSTLIGPWVEEGAVGFLASFDRGACTEIAEGSTE